MATPLSEKGIMALNSAANLDTAPQDDYQVTSYTTQTSTDNDDSSGPPSSPFITNVSDTDLENISPSKMPQLTTKSPIDREPTSPLKTLKSRTSPTPRPQSSSKDGMRSPRKLSDKRFPVKPSFSSPAKQIVPVERSLSIDDVLKDNEGLTKAISILEDGASEIGESAGDDTITSLESVHGGDEINMDDTMISTFSDFSAVPDLTMLAKIGHSPSKFSTLGPIPRRNPLNTPATARHTMHNNYSPSPTPRGQRLDQTRDDSNETNLMDFTEQFNSFSGRTRDSPAKQARQSPIKSSTMPDMSWASTPVSRNNMSNLLDFDIPPAPTPRSMPTITPRELESLKSGFLSEISSLKASLSGKEAEVNSLKTAVGDAEKRVGESMEQVREERNLKEQLAAEKEEWDKRGREMEAVLRNVKEEILHGERERDELEGRLDETERRREAAETMAQEAESKLAAMKAGKTTPSSEPSNTKPGECVCGGRAVELAVEKVSRELHTLYKDKHETKVAALKKSYERRWDKKVKELEEQVEDLSKENEELKLGRDTTMTKVEPKTSLEATQEIAKAAARDAKAHELEAKLEGLNEVIKSVKHDNSELRQLLDDERTEKSKLVQTVEEMVPLLAAFDDMLLNMDNAPPTTTKHSIASPYKQIHHPTQVENLRGSISRASGLRAPTSVSSESRIGRGGFGMPAPGHEKRSGSSQGTRPGSGMGYRSGIMNSIERMGSHKGRGE